MWYNKEEEIRKRVNLMAIFKKDNNNVKNMTKDELYFAISSGQGDKEFLKQCVLENERRMNVFLKKHLKEETKRGKKLEKAQKATGVKA